MAKSTTAPLVFVSGYLLAWAAAGVLAYAVADLGRSLLGSELSWDRAAPGWPAAYSSSRPPMSSPLGIVLMVAPEVIPGLTIPSDGGPRTA